MRKSRAEQDWHPALRSLGAACAPPSWLRWSATPAPCARATPRLVNWGHAPRCWRGSDRRLGGRPRAAAQRRPRSPGGATVREARATLACPPPSKACRGQGWPCKP